MSNASNIQESFISIVIPFHNEEESLKELIPLLIKVMSGIDLIIEIIFVDDCSNDGSALIIEPFCQDNKNMKLLQLKKRGGQTGAYKVAFEQARGKYILRMDADLQDDPRDIPLFISKMNDNSDLIIGLREARKASRILRITSALYDILILLLFNSPLHSNSGSFVAFKSVFVKGLPWYKNDHRYLPIIAMHRGASDIREVFVRHMERQFGTSKYNIIKKVSLGFPEVILFLIRLKRGKYNCNHH